MPGDRACSRPPAGIGENVESKRGNLFLGLSLVFAIALWGGNNTGTKLMVAHWPPLWTGGSRFFCAGLLLLAILKWTRWLGEPHVITRQMAMRLWIRGGSSLAAYIVCFIWSLRYTTVSHVALYLGAAPIWALLWEGRPAPNWSSARRYGAAMLALGGVWVLFQPALKSGNTRWLGEVLGLSSSILWTNYGRQCRALGSGLSGAEVSAHTMWRAGALLLPLGLFEVFHSGLEWRADLVLVQLYCILPGGVVAFGIWSHALSRWPASQVLLFNNLIPLSTMTWAHFWLGEPVTPTFWTAMALIIAGVALGQLKLEDRKIEAATTATPE